MQSVCKWQAWRARYLPIAESIVHAPTACRPAASISPRVHDLTSQVRRQTSLAAATDSPPKNIPAEERIHRFFRHGLDELYPRNEASNNAVTVLRFRTLHHALEDGGAKENESYVVRGRINSVRSGSSKLFFYDIVQDGHQLQVLCSYSRLPEPKEVDRSRFRATCNDLSRGDIISIRGHPYRTERGELSIRATEMPKLLSPCLQAFPVAEFDRSEKDKQSLVNADRHIQLLTVRNTLETLRCRSLVIRCIRQFLLRKDFMEVNTPILGAVASGASARAFETTATEFPDRRLALRIAPELWLKRLILGGLERVFEIGPAFRNEGLDKTHNPEFTTCEFYQAHATLPELMGMTEELLRFMQSRAEIKHCFPPHNLPIPPASLFASDFPRLEFIPSIENALGLRLPNLSDPVSAESSLLQIFRTKSLPLPSLPTLPRLLDKLCSIYLEPRCDRPTFITHHPECLSPLAKSYLDPTTNQRIAARAELFIASREIANMYEEENSPFEQRRKFDLQKDFAGRARELALSASASGNSSNGNSSTLDDEQADLQDTLEPDEAYLDALEWGLPPTGGWGCGIDRLVMLFAGKERIADVLTFGSLRSVTRTTAAAAAAAGNYESGGGGLSERSEGRGDGGDVDGSG